MQSINFEQILSPERIRLKAQAGSKKKTLELLGQCLSLSSDNLAAQDIVDSLCAREKLSSTGIGHGIAIPHARFSNIEQTTGAIVTLASPVDFDAIDNEPVDFFFALLVPSSANEEHLNILSSVAQLMNDPKMVKTLRTCDDKQELYNITISGLGQINNQKGVA